MQKKNSKTHRAKKSLGQNFLKSELALRKIIETGEIKKSDVVLEIGPGKGALTKKLLATGCQVLAVEKDNALYEMLKIKFQKEIFSQQLILIEDDILEFNISEAVLTFANGLAGEGTQKIEDLSKSSKRRDYKIIANIPYNITGAILKKFLTEKHQPELMVLMVQHEVAQRITTPGPSSTRRGGKESILSISVKAYGEPKMIMKVPARYFSPSPKVDSAIISIKNISRKLFIEVQDRILNSLEFEEKFWEIVKKGFAHKRKKLSSNLKGVVLPQSVSLAMLENKRAEDLSLEDWIALTKMLQ